MPENNEVLENYILNHIDPEPQLLHELYRFTHLHHLYPRMCSGHYQGRLLKMLTAMVRPAKVLEIGTYTGYSTLSIAEALPRNAVIDTVEIDVEKEDELRRRFSSSDFAQNIRLHIGDALDIVESLDQSYDLVFIDGNKRNYWEYLEAVFQVTHRDSFILVDNTLWDMKVVAGDTPSDAQTKAIAEFNDRLAADTRFEKVILPVRDGLTLIRRIV